MKKDENLEHFKNLRKEDNRLDSVSRGGFHKPIYAIRQALTLCAKLLRSFLGKKVWRRA